MKILLIEDNQTIARQVVEFLSAHGWQVDYAHTGGLGIQLATEQIFDVILLDLNLPDLDGLQVCEQIKAESQTTPAVLMLTARDSFEDKSAGFHQGADDYLTKPFDLRELVLRCQALSRRQSLHQTQHLGVGELTLDLNSRTAQRQDRQLPLTSIGFQILTLLARAHPEPVSRSMMIHKIWGDSPPDSDALKSHIYALRRAVDKPFDHPMITTVLNVGYKLELSDEVDHKR